MNIIEAFREIGIQDAELEIILVPITRKVIADLGKKGYVVADSKPSHIIIGEENIGKTQVPGRKERSGSREKKRSFLIDLVEKGDYSVIDYELLMRTPVYDEHVKKIRRHTYLDDQRDRFKPSRLPSYLRKMEIFGVPYIHGQVESTGGLLWVVGRNPRLFDYFLPERWRKTPSLETVGKQRYLLYSHEGRYS